MTGPWLAVTGPPEAEDALRRAAARLRAAGWTLRAAADAVEVWTRGAGAPVAPLEDGPGWRIGRAVVSGHPGTRRDSLPPSDRARRLCHDTWGAYVALILDAAGVVHALRDPSGAVEAWTWQAGPLAVLASGLEAAPPDLRPARLALDLDAVGAILARPFETASLSGLAGVRGVVAGELLRLGDPAAGGEPVWAPGALAGRARDPDPEAWAGRLRDAIDAAVAGAVGPHARVLAEVSGGLDSAIVLAALVGGGLGDRLAGALHYVGDRAESDERVWAAAVADPLGAPLTCVARTVGDLDPERDFGPLCGGARPPFAALDAGRDADVAARLAGAGASAVVTGMGGDASLFEIPTARVLADLLVDRGVRALGDPLGLAVARALRRAIWSVWAGALASLPRPDRTHPSPFAAVGLRQDGGGWRHPWIAGAADLPPARRWQVASLAGLQLIRGPDRRSVGAERLHPLLSQPVMAACLEIPVWGLVRDGRGRGLARHAFAGRLPPAVLGRASKGGLTSLYSRRLAASAERLTPYLCEGALAAAGLLDRGRVAAALAPEALIRRQDGLALVRVAALEAWARRWS